MTDNMTNLIAEARALSGEGQGRRQLPTLKFMGRDSKYGTMGHFYLLRKDDDSGELKSEDLNTTIEIVVLKIRKILDNEKAGAERRSTFEFDSATPETIVGVKSEGVEPELLTYREAKAKYQDLKYHDVLYVAYHDELYKMKLSGSSLADWFR
jgi:hypothetical protein